MATSETQRWLAVAMVAVDLLGLDADAEARMLNQLYAAFADIDDDHWPPVDGTELDGARATKMLLWSLLSNRLHPELASRGREVIRGTKPRFHA